MNQDRLTQNPYDIFDQWFADAKQSEINDPNAMALACLDEDNNPSVRMVLMKQHDARGFCFFTNYNSRKGKGLLKHPKAEVCFHWKSLEKQIRILGDVEKLGNQESDDYYNSRHRSSRIGAWASAQTTIMETQDSLEKRIEHFEKQFDGVEDIPRPPHWGGFRIKPTRMEFWQQKEFRLHDRWFYTQDENGNWIGHWLYP